MCGQFLCLRLQQRTVCGNRACRLRGLRFVHTHLQGEPLSQDDLTDLALLRFDAIVALEETVGTVRVGVRLRNGSWICSAPTRSALDRIQLASRSAEFRSFWLLISRTRSRFCRETSTSIACEKRQQSDKATRMADAGIAVVRDGARLQYYGTAELPPRPALST